MNCRRIAAAHLSLLIACLVWLPSASADGRRSDSRRARSPVKAGARRVEPVRRVSRTDSRRDTRSSPDTPEGRLGDELHQIWAGRILRRGVTAVYVVDARTGKDIYSVHADDKLNPASNVKLMSTATVLDLMGPEWRYLTRLFGPAPDREGVARGSVYLRGNFDPTLGRPSLDDVAKTVARAGVKRVEGDVLLSDDLMRETIDSPRIRIRVHAADRSGDAPRVTVDPADSFVQVHVNAVTTTSRRARLVVTAEPIAMAEGQPAAGAWDGPRVLVRVDGTIRQGRTGTYLRSVGMRSTFTGYAMRQALRSAGVQVTGGVRLALFDDYTREALAAGFLPIELGRHRSRSMQELVARVNKKSLNVMADRLLMTAGAEAAGGGPPSMEHGIEAMYRWLERSGLDRKEIVLDTGSGLSHKTKMTVRHLVRVLRTATGYNGSPAAPLSLLDPNTYRASLAVGGVDGTLRGRFRSDALRGKVFGKTGTLRDSVALTGLISDGSGNAICFAIVTNGNRWDARGRIRREHEQMVAAMKRYLDVRNEAERRTAEASSPGSDTQATPTTAALKSASAEPTPDSSDESADDDEAGEGLPENSDPEGGAGDTAGEPSDAAE